MQPSQKLATFFDISSYNSSKTGWNFFKLGLLFVQRLMINIKVKVFPQTLILENCSDFSKYPSSKIATFSHFKL